MSFEVETGLHSLRGRRQVNEDCGGWHRAPGRGLIAALADGVSAGGGGREAAQATVGALLADFPATPPTWETTVALDRVLEAQNAWLADHNRRRQAASRNAAVGLTTVTALVVHGQGYTVAHVGDTRCWRLHGGMLQRLTQDHAFDHIDLKSRLTRAVGLDDQVRADYVQGEVFEGDAFLLTSDGVHGVLSAERLAALAVCGTAQQACEAIVDEALGKGGTDNASALLVRLRTLDAARFDDERGRGLRLPVPGPLSPGDVLDGYAIAALVADTGVHRLYRARFGADGPDEGRYLLKTLHPSRAGDAEERAMLAHEAWLGARLTELGAVGFVRVHPAREPSALYIAFDWHAGTTLEALFDTGRRFTVAEVVDAAQAIVRALARLHRLGVVHRDVKPGNLHLGADGRWRLLDLGVAVSGQEPAAQRDLHAGTPSYMNPEQWEGARADAASDLYAFGVTLYRWLGGRLPYGDVEPWQTGRHRRDPRPLSRLAPDVPMWLDHLVRRAVALDPKQRFETAEEMLLAFERGAARNLQAPPATPLAVRDPVALWRIACAVSALLNLLLIVWLLYLPR